MNDETKQDLYFMIYHKIPNYAGEHEYGEIKVLVMTIDQAGKPHGISYGEYEDLQIRAVYQTVRREYEETDIRCLPRHWDLEYRDLYSIGLEKAKMMVKVLSKVETKLKGFAENYGEVTDLASFTVRVGRALGVKGFWHKIHDGGPGTTYDESEWTVCKLTDANWLIGIEIDKAREQFIRNGG
jgi:hypothetical protein